MTPSLPSISVRRSAIAAVLAMTYTALTFGATLAPAPVNAAETVYYRAELAAPASEDRAIAGGVAWLCKETTCIAAKGTSRPLRVCRELAKEVGPLASFSAKGEAMEEDKLDTCNGN